MLRPRDCERGDDDQEEEQFEIVSECYVNEIVDGQGLEMLGEEVIVLERFCLS